METSTGGGFSGVTYVLLGFLVLVGISLIGHIFRAHGSKAPTDAAPSPAALNLTRYDVQPRLNAIRAAARYHWKCTFRWYDDEGKMHEVTTDAPELPHTPQKLKMKIMLNVDDHKIPIELIKTIIVHAASSDTSERYSVSG